VLSLLQFLLFVLFMAIQFGVIFELPPPRVAYPS
jgi:hypothetical protein